MVAARGGIQAVVEAMKEHLESVKVQLNGIGALVNLAVDDAIEAAVVAKV